MEDVQIISKGENHKAIDIGNLTDLAQYGFTHPAVRSEVKGKLFVGEILESTATEISFQELASKTTIPFLHTHKEHEEIYIFIKGVGQFQVDEQCFDIQEGSVVRVSPNGKRTLRNDSEHKMIYMVIQAAMDTISAKNIADGMITRGEIKLKK